MGKFYVAVALLAICAIVLFFIQRKHRSELLVTLTAVCAGAALVLLVVLLCTNAIFVRPLYD